MSSTPSISAFDQILIQPRPVLAASRGVPVSSRVLRRRPTMTQGQALEALGHAIEYLYDSQVYRTAGNLTPSDAHAIEILMRLSREVFSDCRDAAPAGRGLRHWLLRLLPERPAA